ncbi:MAG: hypothetical protein ACREBO_00445 [Novosphingobium sp.]
MNDAQDDPLLGLLTDIVEGVAALAACVDAMETEAAVHREQVNEALATIAEIALRTYYVSKPPSALPDDIINASVMDPMIERWPQGAVVGMSSHGSSTNIASPEIEGHCVCLVPAQIKSTNCSTQIIHRQKT